MLLQVIITVLIFLAWLNTLMKFRMKKINLGEFGLWSLLWVILLVTSLFPAFISEVSSWFGIGRGVDLVIYGSLFVIFFVLFKLYVRMEEQERNITELVRQVAIKRVRKK